MQIDPMMLACHGLLTLLLITAAILDLKSRTIPNWLTASVAALAVPFWILSGYAFWPDMATQLALALVCFLLFSVAFAKGMMGGGDVKLISALALWFPLLILIPFLLRMSILGGVLTLGMWALEKARKSNAAIEVPYGVAIVLAALSLL